MATYQQILNAIHQSGADYAWIGLSAAAVHGSPLVSYDFDFFVRPSAEHLDLARAALTNAGMEESHRGIHSTNLIQGKVTVTFSDAHGGPLVDLLTHIDGPTFDQVWEASAVREVDDIRVRVASLRHIIESKKAAGREKDLAAIERLEQELPEARDLSN